MIYISSKGERQSLSEMNQFHLKAAIQKLEKTRNFVTGFQNSVRNDYPFLEEVVRYLDILRENLEAELDGRVSDKIEALVQAELSGVNDRSEVVSFIKKHFILKESHEG